VGPVKSSFLLAGASAVMWERKCTTPEQGAAVQNSYSGHERGGVCGDGCREKGDQRPTPLPSGKKKEATKQGEKPDFGKRGGKTRTSEKKAIRLARKT